jgi:hypothetical protein
VKVSLNSTIAAFHIDLAEIIQDVNVHSRSELINQIQKSQEQIIMQLCGPKYSRKHSFKFKRAGSYTKKVTTLLGNISLKVQKVRNRIDNSIASPILEYLDLKRRKYSKDLRMKLAEYASKMSYQDASSEFETATGIHVPKRTIHRFVQEIAPRLLQASNAQNHPAEETETMMGDTTEVRALCSREMNMVHVLISGGGELLHIDVNGEWPNPRAETLISDSEPGLTNAVDVENRQIWVRRLYHRASSFSLKSMQWARIYKRRKGTPLPLLVSFSSSFPLSSPGRSEKQGKKLPTFRCWG